MSPLILFLIKTVLLAMTAVGGAMAVLPDVSRFVVHQMHWMTAEELAKLVTIAQAAPGPNMMFMPLIGWQEFGVLGAIAGAIGFCLPSGIVIAALFPKWEAIKGSPLKAILERILGAMGVGMIFAGAIFFLKMTWSGSLAALVTLAVAALGVKTKIPPVLLIIAGGVVGPLIL